MTHRKAKERNRRMRSRENKYKTTDRVGDLSLNISVVMKTRDQVICCFWESHFKFNNVVGRK